MAIGSIWFIPCFLAGDGASFSSDAASNTWPPMKTRPGSSFITCTAYRKKTRTCNHSKQRYDSGSRAPQSLSRGNTIPGLLRLDELLKLFTRTPQQPVSDRLTLQIDSASAIWRVNGRSIQSKKRFPIEHEVIVCRKFTGPSWRDLVFDSTSVLLFLRTRYVARWQWEMALLCVAARNVVGGLWSTFRKHLVRGENGLIGVNFTVNEDGTTVTPTELNIQHKPVKRRPSTSVVNFRGKWFTSFVFVVVNGRQATGRPRWRTSSFRNVIHWVGWSRSKSRDPHYSDYFLISYLFR